MGTLGLVTHSVPSSNIQILFVDDDLEFSWLVVAYVKRRLNVPVRVASSYADAASALALQKFDLIICGLETPEHSSSLYRFATQHVPTSAFVLFTSNDSFERKALAGSNFRGHVSKTQIANLVALISSLTTTSGT